jgi:hypothetical protein
MAANGVVRDDVERVARAHGVAATPRAVRAPKVPKVRAQRAPDAAAPPVAVPAQEERVACAVEGSAKPQPHVVVAAPVMRMEAPPAKRVREPTQILLRPNGEADVRGSTTTAPAQDALASVVQRAIDDFESRSADARQLGGHVAVVAATPHVGGSPVGLMDVFGARCGSAVSVSGVLGVSCMGSPFGAPFVPW